MEDLIKEIRGDVKKLLTNQARMEERNSFHEKELHETKIELDEIKKEIEPVKHIKWLVGSVMLLLPSIITIVVKLGVK